MKTFLFICLFFCSCTGSYEFNAPTFDPQKEKFRYRINDNFDKYIEKNLPRNALLKLKEKKGTNLIETISIILDTKKYYLKSLTESLVDSVRNFYSNVIINKNKEPFIFLHLLMSKEPITIVYKKVNMDQKEFTFIGEGDDSTQFLDQFKKILDTNELDFELSIRPECFLYLRKNKSVILNLFYEYRISNSPSANYIQENKSIDCIIDNNGNIKIPPIYESKATNVSPPPFGTATLSFFEQWSRALSNTHILKLFDDNSPITYFDAGRIITNFYYDQFSSKGNFPDINPFVNFYVEVNLPIEETDIQIITNDLSITLPYEYKRLDSFFSNPLLFLTYGLEIENDNILVIPASSIFRTGRFNFFFSEKGKRKEIPYIYPGDKIIIY